LGTIGKSREKTPNETTKFRASARLRGRGHAGPDRRQVEGRDPVSPAGGHAALWRTAAPDARDHPAYADQAASRARGRQAHHPQGLCRGAAAGGILPLRDRREPQTRDRYAEGLGREPSGTAILRPRNRKRTCQKSAATRGLVTFQHLLSAPI